MNIKDHPSRLPWVLWGIAVMLTAGVLPYPAAWVLDQVAAGELSDGEKVLLVAKLVLPVVGVVLLVPALRRPGPSGVGWLAAGVLSGMMTLGSLYPSAVLGAGLIGLWGRRPLHIVGVITAVGAALAWFTTLASEERGGWYVLVPLVIGLFSATLLGMLLRGQQELADARVAQSRAEERARISREMHDSLAHRLSLISLHATALGNRTDLAPEVVASTARTIHTLTAEAGRELRQILHVLHDGSSSVPVVTWADVKRDLQRQRDGGLRLEVQMMPGWEGRFAEAEAAIRHAVLRVVEEMLSNARRHGDGEATISFETNRDGLVVRCGNRVGRLASPDAGHGLGLPGMGERLRLCGGRFELERAAGRFSVVAEFPIRQAVTNG